MARLLFKSKFSTERTVTFRYLDKMLLLITLLHLTNTVSNTLFDTVPDNISNTVSNSKIITQIENNGKLEAIHIQADGFEPTQLWYRKKYIADIVPANHLRFERYSNWKYKLQGTFIRMREGQGEAFFSVGNSGKVFRANGGNFWTRLSEESQFHFRLTAHYPEKHVYLIHKENEDFPLTLRGQLLFHISIESKHPTLGTYPLVAWMTQESPISEVHFIFRGGLYTLTSRKALQLAQLTPQEREKVEDPLKFELRDIIYKNNKVFPTSEDANKMAP